MRGLIVELVILAALGFAVVQDDLCSTIGLSALLIANAINLKAFRS